MTAPWRRLLLVAPLLGGCGSPPEHADVADLTRQFARVAEVEASDRAEVAALGERATELRSRASAVVELWNDSRRNFDEATALSTATKETGLQASLSYTNAIEEFAAAERRYRQATLFMVAVAASSAICGTTENTARFRSRLRAEGVDLRGQDIDHIWPRSLGGIDHPLNYQVLDAHLNRSLGASVVEKFMTQPLAVVQGLAASALAALSC